MHDHVDHKDKVSGVCPKTDRNTSKWRGKWAQYLFPLIGLLSLIWFVVRVFPKPSRASYPCMRMAVPLTFSFMLWIAGLGGSVVALRKVRECIKESRYLLGALCLSVTLVAACVCVFGVDGRSASAWLQSTTDNITPADPVNDPIGEPKGLNPGRVVWVHDPDATNWEGPGSGEYWWQPGHTDQTVVDRMMSHAICWLAGKPDDAEA